MRVIDLNDGFMFVPSDIGGYDYYHKTLYAPFLLFFSLKGLCFLFKVQYSLSVCRNADGIIAQASDAVYTVALGVMTGDSSIATSRNCSFNRFLDALHGMIRDIELLPGMFNHNM